MSLSTVVADIRRSVAETLPSEAPVSAAPPAPAAGATSPSTPATIAPESSSAAADSFFPEDEMNRGFGWSGRRDVVDERLVWRLSGEMYARVVAGVQLPARGVAVEGGPGGLAAEAHSWRAETGFGAHDAHRVDLGSGAAGIGVVNGDGSVGVHANAGANVIGYEGSYDRGGFRFAGGASFGAGGGGSLGLRDQDGDGRIEICSSVSAGPVSVGTCYEPYTVAETAWNLASDAAGAMHRMVSSMRP
jgi:hypothetical protein